MVKSDGSIHLASRVAVSDNTSATRLPKPFREFFLFSVVETEDSSDRVIPSTAPACTFEMMSPLWNICVAQIKTTATLVQMSAVSVCAWQPGTALISRLILSLLCVQPPFFWLLDYLRLSSNLPSKFLLSTGSSINVAPVKAVISSIAGPRDAIGTRCSVEPNNATLSLRAGFLRNRLSSSFFFWQKRRLLVKWALCFVLSLFNLYKMKVC